MTDASERRITAALDGLKKEVHAFELLGLERIEHVSNGLQTTVTLHFDGRDAVVIPEDEWVVNSAIIKSFMRHGIALSNKTNWEVIRPLILAAAEYIETDDGWGLLLGKYVNVRPAGRDYLIEGRAALVPLTRGSATSIAYGDDARLIDLSEFAAWATKERKRQTTLAIAQLRLQPYIRMVADIPSNLAVVPAVVEPVKLVGGNASRERGGLRALS